MKKILSIAGIVWLRSVHMESTVGLPIRANESILFLLG